ncbi:MAG: DegT/DnrJ/EryC1/StrS family aminotransferase [Fimbriimonadaceae bacterium]|nr:DegT/DnrJ/EryC1/StrS family aminotransferase [Fimbriimonadaceae bacterium]
MAAATLALLGGPKAVTLPAGDLFTWPIITAEDEAAVLEVLRRGAMSGTDVTAEFEKEFGAWHQMPYCVGVSSGTAALQSAMWACGVRRGDEVIGPSLTYWASVLPAYSLGAAVVFAEVEPHSLCLDPRDLEHRITPRTKAIVVVHYCGYPADMDPIMAIARKHGVKVIEDVSHAHGGLYQSRLVGTLGDVSAMSCMSGKSFAIGEAGMILTRDLGIAERCQAWGLYERTTSLTDPELAHFAGLPWGGYKYRMHQLSAAVGRVQLRHYAERMERIQAAMNRFWDLLDGVPGVHAHRPAADSGGTMGGWYAAHGLYAPEELGGLSVAKFCEAVRAEGAPTYPGANRLLHSFPLFHEADIYGDGQPTAIATADRDLRQPLGSLPVSEALPTRCYGIPWFKWDRPAEVAEYALAFRKAAEHADRLLAEYGDEARHVDTAVVGSAGLFARR